MGRYAVGRAAQAVVTLLVALTVIWFAVTVLPGAGVPVAAPAAAPLDVTPVATVPRAPAATPARPAPTTRAPTPPARGR